MKSILESINSKFDAEKARSLLKIKTSDRQPFNATRSQQEMMHQLSPEEVNPEEVSLEEVSLEELGTEELGTEAKAFRLRVVESNIIYAVGYAPSSQTLVILSNQGKIYRYFAVPKGVYEGLLVSDAVDRYLRESIMGCYACVQVRRRGRKRHR